MIHVKAPNPINSDVDLPRLFLAGSIEMGVAEKWQDWVASRLSDKDVILLNPRRDDWDSSWEQIPEKGTKFYEQVEWELSHQNHDTDIHAFYFAANTMSPITLLEFGLTVNDPFINPIVYVDDAYLRRGNVIMTCNYYDMDWTDDKEEFIELLRKSIDDYKGIWR